MNLMELIIPTFIDFFEWPGPLYLVLGASVGMLFGILPGLGGPQAVVLLLPLTFGLEPRLAITTLIGASGATAFSGSVTAILINTPGTAVNAATCFDGFPLARQGKAGMALGASATSSALGAIFGAIILTLVLPIGRKLVLAFSYPEYFMLAILGLSIIVVISRETLLKGFIAAILGLLFSSFGYCGITGSVRFTFGLIYLWDGIKLVPALIGLFAIAEAVDLFIGRGTIARTERFEGAITGVFEGVKSVFKHFRVFLRSAIIGTIIGIIPGVGGSVSNFIAYAHIVQSSKDKEKFGHGDIRGVIAPEAANDAKDGGALIPTLIFGIPGSIVMAVLLGALMIHGIEPGPRMMLDYPELILILIWALVFSNLFTSTVGLLLSLQLSKITLIPTTIVAPVIFVLSILGTYALNKMFADVVVVLIFGLLGFAMKRFDYPRISLVIALVLGGLAQKSFHQTIMALGIKGFIIRPISLGLLIATIVLLVFSLAKSKREGEAV
jgi:TctA family transporter